MTTDIDEKTQIAHLAIGRIFRILSRPTAPGDIAEYERCRAVVLSLSRIPA